MQDEISSLSIELYVFVDPELHRYHAMAERDWTYRLGNHYVH